MPKRKNRRGLYDQRKNMHRCKSYSLDPVDANEGNPVEVNEGDMVSEGDPVHEGNPVDVDEGDMVHVSEGDPVDVSEGNLVHVISTMTDELNHCALFLLQLLPKQI